ncbi:hypothetical protein [Bacillus horti]|uniref:DUF4025 domain-containing protein n=1 Tax=Caldalkalibacillus horti TaxID=77523 RepID=A0ABT9W4A9_9BACI|nr:hypothetical protein [Bacillus horti]MDQ0168081.1 hypothetical protein [Bacillus horti]
MSDIEPRSQKYNQDSKEFEDQKLNSRSLIESYNQVAGADEVEFATEFGGNEANEFNAANDEATKTNEANEAIRQTHDLVQETYQQSNHTKDEKAD